MCQTVVLHAHKGGVERQDDLVERHVARWNKPLHVWFAPRFERVVNEHVRVQIPSVRRLGRVRVLHGDDLVPPCLRSVHAPISVAPKVPPRTWHAQHGYKNYKNERHHRPFLHMRRLTSARRIHPLGTRGGAPNAAPFVAALFVTALLVQYALRVFWGCANWLLFLFLCIRGRFRMKSRLESGSRLGPEVGRQPEPAEKN